MELTTEQKKIINASSDKARIIAFAGTGKTSTLVELAKNRPQKKFLYIAFNKAIKLEAESKFPSNVECKTMHALAFADVGKFYREADKLINRIKPFQVDGFANNMYVISQTLTTIRNFCYSKYDTINDENVPESVKSPARDKIIYNAKNLWKRMVDKEDPMKIEHDVYFKIAQLSGQLARRLKRYDSVLLDEAQDANPAMLAALKEANGSVIAVGDPHQAIYGFRGCYDAFADLSGDTFFLTHSFRFGESIADLATRLLCRFKNEENSIVGAGEESEVVWDENSIQRQVARQNQHMVICRTNTGVLSAAIDCLFAKPQVSYHIIGGCNEEIFRTTRSIAGVMFNRPDEIKDPMVKHFENPKGLVFWLSDLKKYAEENNDAEIKIGCSLCESYGNRIFDILDEVRANNCPTEKDARQLITTAHKAKGLEADIVFLDDDFATFATSIFQNEFPLQENGEQEINLLYVAITRARKLLFVNDILRDWMKTEKEFQERMSE
ncbi:MAG: UvrD-helicase domain-containing protein [Gammaproteobacteria bacterium WSBS_2016_MAG_OTU1]